LRQLYYRRGVKIFKFAYFCTAMTEKNTPAAPTGAGAAAVEAPKSLKLREEDMWRVYDRAVKDVRRVRLRALRVGGEGGAYIVAYIDEYGDKVYRVVNPGDWLRDDYSQYREWAESAAGIVYALRRYAGSTVELVDVDAAVYVVEEVEVHKYTHRALERRHVMAVEWKDGPYNYAIHLREGEELVEP